MKTTVVLLRGKVLESNCTNRRQQLFCVNTARCRMLFEKHFQCRVVNAKLNGHKLTRVIPFYELHTEYTHNSQTVARARTTTLKLYADAQHSMYQYWFS